MNQIERIRKSVLGMSQARLAEIAGVRQSTISRWEKDELSPSMREVSRIVVATNGAVTANDFMTPLAEIGSQPDPVAAAGPQAAAAASRVVHPPARDALSSDSRSSPLSARDAAGHSAGALSRPPAAFPSAGPAARLDAAE